MTQSSSTTTKTEYDGGATGGAGGGPVDTLVTQLIDALRAVRPGPGEVTTFQQALIEEHAELKRLLRGPDLVTPGPAITKVEALSSSAGFDVTVSGERLGDTTLVRIGARRIDRDAFTAIGDTTIKFTVPPTTTTGEVIVFSPLGVAASFVTFTAPPPPVTRSR
jgi:hypothetical protein